MVGLKSGISVSLSSIVTGLYCRSWQLDGTEYLANKPRYAERRALGTLASLVGVAGQSALRPGTGSYDPIVGLVRNDIGPRARRVMHNFDYRFQISTLCLFLIS